MTDKSLRFELRKYSLDLPQRTRSASVRSLCVMLVDDVVLNPRALHPFTAHVSVLDRLDVADTYSQKLWFKNNGREKGILYICYSSIQI